MSQTAASVPLCQPLIGVESNPQGGQSTGPQKTKTGSYNTVLFSIHVLAICNRERLLEKCQMGPI